MASKNLEEQSDLFASLPYFKDLRADIFEAVVRSAARKSYEPNQIVLLEGDPAGGLHIVQEGWLKASKISLDGREQVLQFLGQGEAFNAVGVFTEAASPATVTALEASVIWVIPRQEMRKLLTAYPDLAWLVIQDLAGRVLHLITLVEDLSLRKVESRLARMLLEEAAGDVIQRQRWATQNEIAARLGTVTDVISRTLRRLSDQGVLRVERTRIQILDRGRLEEIAGESSQSGQRE